MGILDSTSKTESRQDFNEENTENVDNRLSEDNAIVGGASHLDGSNGGLENIHVKDDSYVSADTNINYNSIDNGAVALAFKGINQSVGGANAILGQAIDFADNSVQESNDTVKALGLGAIGFAEDGLAYIKDFNRDALGFTKGINQDSLDYGLDITDKSLDAVADAGKEALKAVQNTGEMAIHNLRKSNEDSQRVITSFGNSAFARLDNSFNDLRNFSEDSLNTIIDGNAKALNSVNDTVESANAQTENALAFAKSSTRSEASEALESIGENAKQISFAALGLGAVYFIAKRVL